MILNREDIPQGMISEINDNFNFIDWSSYGEHVPHLPEDIIDNVSTKKLDYSETIDSEIKNHTAIDPQTFEPSTTRGITVRKYLARGVWNEENSTCKLIQILVCGPVIVPEEEIETTKEEMK